MPKNWTAPVRGELWPLEPRPVEAPAEAGGHELSHEEDGRYWRLNILGRIGEPEIRRVIDETLAIHPDGAPDRFLVDLRKFRKGSREAFAYARNSGAMLRPGVVAFLTNDVMQRLALRVAVRGFSLPHKVFSNENEARDWIRVQPLPPWMPPAQPAALSTS
ncbi:MAG: STAS/SEC14 domain-containing protein [Methanobacteriota archaeon]